jgi:hypothetical protein
LQLGDDLPRAVDIVNWYYEDHHELPPINATLVDWLASVDRGINLWNQQHANGPVYWLIRKANHNPALGAEDQAMVNSTIQLFPIRAIAALGGWTTQ